MKLTTLKVSFIAVAALTLMAFTAKNPHVDGYKLDTKLSSMEWFGEKVTGKHNGIIKVSNGEVKNDHGSLTGWVEIDMNTIENTDMADAGYREKLVGHLKSADFFDVEKFPKSKFIISSVTPLAEKKEGIYTHTVKGNLTIKDKTNPVEFDVILKMEANRMICTGTAVIDRSKYDVKYGSPTFFESIGDKAIYDEFKIRLNIVASK